MKGNWHKTNDELNLHGTNGSEIDELNVISDMYEIRCEFIICENMQDMYWKACTAACQIWVPCLSVDVAEFCVWKATYESCWF